MSTLDWLREKVYQANLELERRGLVLYTFGNASGLDRERGLMVIKPSGVSYQDLTPAQLVVVDLTGKVVEGTLRPSSDTPTHLALYRHFPDIGGVVHTHSTYATAWAQAYRTIPCLGTTHADYCHGMVPCTQPLTDEQVRNGYEHQTGMQIVNAIGNIDRRACPMCLVAGHGPFTWGRDATEAAHHAAILEELAKLAWLTQNLNPLVSPLRQSIADHHFERKHGPHATYGQSRPA